MWKTVGQMIGDYKFAEATLSLHGKIKSNKPFNEIATNLTKFRSNSPNLARAAGMVGGGAAIGGAMGFANGVVNPNVGVIGGTARGALGGAAIGGLAGGATAAGSRLYHKGLNENWRWAREMRAGMNEAIDQGIRVGQSVGDNSYIGLMNSGGISDHNIHSSIIDNNFSKLHDMYDTAASKLREGFKDAGGVFKE